MTKSSYAQKGQNQIYDQNGQDQIMLKTGKIKLCSKREKSNYAKKGQNQIMLEKGNLISTNQPTLSPDAVIFFIKAFAFLRTLSLLLCHC